MSDPAYSFWCSKCKTTHAGECTPEKNPRKEICLTCPAGFCQCERWQALLPKADTPWTDHSIPWKPGEVWAVCFGLTAIVFVIRSSANRVGHHDVEILAERGWTGSRKTDIGRGSCYGEYSLKVADRA